MAENSYFTLKLKGVRREEVDPLSGWLFSFGGAGTAENLEFEQSGDCYEPVSHFPDPTELSCYFLSPPDRQLMEWIQQRYPGIQIEVVESENRDWMQEWKNGFQSFPLTDRHWVVPSWLEPPTGAQSWIQIDPGMAFGTGTHATTQLAATLLDNQKQSLAGASLLDVGTGTGILAILAEQLGAGPIVGLEVDEMARDVARTNVKLNHCQSVSITDQAVEDVQTTFDWVVANIIDGVLLQLRPHLTRLTKRPGGRLLLTGVLEERAASFLPHWLEDFKLLGEFQQEEWKGYLLESRP